MDEQKILLVRTQGLYSAVGSKCSHYGAPLIKGIIYTHTHACTHTHIGMDTSRHVRGHTHAHGQSYAQAHTHGHTHTSHGHTNMDTHTHTYTIQYADRHVVHTGKQTRRTDTHMVSNTSVRAEGVLSFFTVFSCF